MVASSESDCQNGAMKNDAIAGERHGVWPVPVHATIGRILMRKFITPALFSLAALAACNEPATTNEMAANEMAGAIPGTAYPATVPAATTAITTPDFVNRMAMSDMYEVRAAKIALEKSQDEEIRQFAQMMVDDHSAATDKLKGIIASENLATPPSTLDGNHFEMINALKAANAEDFDGLYLNQQRKAHETALALLRAYEAGGDNAALQSFASETAPKVSAHLDRVAKLDDEGADDGSA